MTKETIDTLMSSSVTNYSTPQWLFDRLDKEYHFILDAAADKSNHKCKEYYTEADDALSKEWPKDGWIWLNPPYGRSLYIWMEKVAQMAEKGAKIACLIPARVDTKYWHQFILLKPCEVTLIKGRIKFSGNKNSAPFPSAIVVFDKENIKEFVVKTLDIPKNIY